MKIRHAMPLMGAALLAGCSLAALAPDPSGGEAVLRVSPRFQPAGYAAQAVVSPYAAADVNHLVLSLHTVSGGIATPVKDAQNVAVTKDVPNADLGKDVVFAKLKPDTTYRLMAQAYKAAGTAAGNLISTSDAASYVDVAVGRNDRPTIALSVKLIDKPFSASTTLPGVTLTEGDYAASGSIGVTLVPGS